jgi:PEP-CTERM motif
MSNNNRDDRDEQLDQMVSSSDVYKWGFGGYRWGFGGYRQGWSGLQSNATFAEQGFWQNAAWETLDEVDGDHDHNHLSSYSQTQSVPEPTTIVGLLGMAVVAIASRLKLRCQK